MGQVLVQLRIEVRLEDVVERRLLALFLRLERLGIVEHLAVAVAEDVRRVPAADAEQPRLETGRDDRLDQRLPGLHVVAGERRLRPRGELQHAPGCRRSGSARRSRTGSPRGSRRRRRPCSTGSHRRSARAPSRRPPRDACTAVSFMKTSVLPRPDHHQPVAAVLRLERADVGDELLGEIPLVLALLDVRAVEPLDVALVEHGRHRLDGLELAANLVEL